MSRNELKDIEAALTHDLNNTLQVVMGNLEVLRRRAKFEPEIIDAALNATRGAAHLADRLGAVTRLRHLEPQRIELNAALADLDEMMRRILGDAIRLDLDLAPDAGPVLVDPRCLQTALLELATNARAAMPAGGRVLVRSSSGKIEFTDTGPGMPASRRDPNPMALGLQIVERCVSACGGRVDISSAPGHGTTISLYLPAG